MRRWNLPFRYVIGLLVLTALLAFMVYAREALEPLVLAAFIAYLINPAVAILSAKTRLSRRTSVNLVYFTSIVLIIAIPAAVTPFFFDELTGVAQDLLDLLAQFQTAVARPVSVLGLITLDLRLMGAGLADFQAAFRKPLPENAFWLIESTSRGAIWFLVIIVCVYLFLSEWPRMRDWMIMLAPVQFRSDVAGLYGRVRVVWMAYLRGQILLMLIVGLIFTIAWTILGIPGAFVLGVLAGLFTLVPDIGPLLAVALAMGVVLLEGSNWIALPNYLVTLIVFAVYLVLINLKNIWLRPFIMGRSVHMNEGVIFVAILVATILNGILGALLVVPVLASALIVIEFLLQRVLGQGVITGVSPRRFSRKKNRN